MRYNIEQLEELADKVDIVELIGETENLHKKGQNYFVNCPFHTGDDTPSLCINPVTNRWHCFGCGSGSSVYDWMMHKYKINFPEALERICQRVGEKPTDYIESESIAFLKQLKKQKMSKEVSANNRKILDFTEDYVNKYSDELPEEWLAEDMTEEALRHYNIRIDHDANRIVYPVFDADGNFISVKGRTRIAAYKALGLQKYINYYKVGELDYFAGWQQAFLEITNRKSVVIFEGIKSCIKAYGWGILNTVASETSTLSDGQLKLLIKTGIPEIIIGWDSDQSLNKIINNDKIKLLKKFTQVSIINDTRKLLDEKMSPVDKGEEVFSRLLLERKRL